MSRNVFLKKGEYEFYQISIPFAMMGRKKQRKFIAAELCKRHPCFSDEFCFDYQVGLNKSGFLGNVIVMSKYKLTDIKNSNPHQKIKVKERKASVFNTKTKKVIQALLVCIIMGAVILICSVRMQKKSTIENEQIENETLNYNFEETEIQFQNIDVEKILEIVKKGKGIISRLEWKLENQNQHFLISVRGLYPESFLDSIENIKISAVSYSKNVPLMVVQSNVPYELQNCEEYKKVHFVSLVRTVLQESKCSIKEENNNVISFSFTKQEAESSNVVLRIAELVKENNGSILSLIINCQDGALFDVQFEFSDYAAQIIDLELIGKSLDVFSLCKAVPDRPSVSSVVKTGNKQPERMKLGEVTYSDGSKLVFYKTNVGKMVLEKEF